MYSPSMTLTGKDLWSSDQSPFPSAHSPTTIQNEFTRLPERRDSSDGRASPLDPHPATDTNPFRIESFFGQPHTFPIRRTSAPFSRQPVNHHPSMGANPWAPLSHQQSTFNKVLTPKMYVFEAPRCCATPRVRVIHDCCNKESTAREVYDEPQFPRRNFQTASKLTLCRFCLKNGEPPSVYYNHNLHSEDGRVSCPVLRRYDCPICNNGGGDYAHTVRYCPFVRSGIVR